MKSTLAVAIIGVGGLAGCGSTVSFTRGMEEPVKGIANAAALADEAEQNVLKAIASGLATTSLSLGELVCRSDGPGPGDVRSHLQAFGDALDTVRKVGEKPDDTSYVGYIRKFRENQAAGQPPANPATEQEDARKKEFERRTRCEALFKADTAGSTRLASLDGNAALPVFFTRLLGIDQLLKAILGQAETLSREAAVKRTIQVLLPDLRKAAVELKAVPTPTYGPLVRYLPGSAPDAENMNGTVLGATLNVRRWYVAKQASAQWAYLDACRRAVDKKCFGEPAVQAAANGFAASVYSYRSLAKLDSVKVHATVDAAVVAAEKSLDVKGPAAWIDGLIGIADALSTLDDAYGKYDKSKD
ncbi:hypothetical protein DBR42_09825 [Pelomonas sp. HMWF004]|nr:hypothetical protein DBR42_09825 [Pelomonas sp. HMWF004]